MQIHSYLLVAIFINFGIKTTTTTTTKSTKIEALYQDTNK